MNGFAVNQDYNTFIFKFNVLFDQCIPLRKCNVNRRKVPQSTWITIGMLKSIQNKSKLHKDYLQCPNDNRAIKFKTYRNKLNNLIRKSKWECFCSKFKNTRNNIKETWKTINSVIGRGRNKCQQSNFKNEKMETITEPKTVSNTFIFFRWYWTKVSFLNSVLKKILFWLSYQTSTNMHIYITYCSRRNC